MAKKKLKKKNEKKKVEGVSQVEKEQNKQLIVFFTLMLICLGGLIGGYLYVKQLNNFNYAGIDFQKGKEGEITYYHGRFPINYQGQTEKIFNLYLRKDPRSNNIPINTNFSLSKDVIIAFEPGLEKCDKAIVGQSVMTQFVSSFPWVEKVSGAVSNVTYAEEFKINFANCSNATEDKTIILARMSESPSIEREGENCYILNVGDCKYLETSERYIIGVIAQINEVKI